MEKLNGEINWKILTIPPATSRELTGLASPGLCKQLKEQITTTKTRNAVGRTPRLSP